MIRKVIYSLKRAYGFSLDLYKITNVETNLETGKKQRSVKYKRINRAVFVSARFFRSFVYDLSYIAQNKDFTSGGYFDPNDRVIFIDWQESRNFVIEVDDYIIYEDTHYLVSEVRTLEHKTGHIIKVRGVSGAEVIDPFGVTSDIVISNTTSAELT